MAVAAAPFHLIIKTKDVPKVETLVCFSKQRRQVQEAALADAAAAEQHAPLQSR